ncbi:hypothetical protein [Mesorhizobium sp. CA4]|uniref:hypothetical protein n=1 Tax=Mesorhizobium sp. CA4 TaxID=588499 RepID=UPI001CD06DA3|nr:hypothetical protein [Mesorhizobium sp. CA4]MBZ9821366.1 hypothetical protein [Mesorhizobium sp. CA4]
MAMAAGDARDLPLATNQTDKTLLAGSYSVFVIEVDGMAHPLVCNPNDRNADFVAAQDRGLARN